MSQVEGSVESSDVGKLLKHMWCSEQVEVMVKLC